MVNAVERWNQSALVLGMFTLGGGPVALLAGVRTIDRVTTASAIGGWLMIVGGVLMIVGGGITLTTLIRKSRAG